MVSFYRRRNSVSSTGLSSEKKPPANQKKRSAQTQNIAWRAIFALICLQAALNAQFARPRWGHELVSFYMPRNSVSSRGLSSENKPPANPKNRLAQTAKYRLEVRVWANFDLIFLQAALNAQFARPRGGHKLASFYMPRNSASSRRLSSRKKVPDGQNIAWRSVCGRRFALILFCRRL